MCFRAGFTHVVWWLPFAPSQFGVLAISGPMGYLRKPNKLGNTLFSQSLPAIGPHTFFFLSSILKVTAHSIEYLSKNSTLNFQKFLKEFQNQTLLKFVPSKKC